MAGTNAPTFAQEASGLSVVFAHLSLRNINSMLRGTIAAMALKKSGYSRQVVWRDKDELRVWKVEYYDRKEAHLNLDRHGEGWKLSVRLRW